MSQEIRFAFNAMVTERRDGARGQFMTISVQAWQGDEHLTSVYMAEVEDCELGEHVNADAMETFALAANRAISRKLAQVHMDAIDADALHTRGSFGS